MTTATPVAVREPEPDFVQWTPVFSGALVASALFLVLLAFGTALGLSMASSAPTWRDASPTLSLLSGLYLVLTGLLSFGFGGYIAGRSRTRWAALPHNDFVEFRDGTHGLVSWALAVVIVAIIAAGISAVAASKATPTASAPSTTTGEALMAYDLDRLFRSERPVPADIAYSRAEASRILLTAGSHTGIKQDDRQFLTGLVASRTGIAPADADRRVQEAIPAASIAIKRARQSAVIAGFAIAAALLLGAAVAWYTSRLGGQHRDETNYPLRWDLRRTPTVPR
ncbi:MAG TPA: hypothetical protein VHY35_09085 [Stellaceae bacterium]|nr:hypothetical protein [Stellaceae bacterium]